MFGNEFSCFSWWWFIPLGMMALCFFMMNRRRGAWPCGWSARRMDEKPMGPNEAALEILGKRYARSEIDEEGYRSRRPILEAESQS